MEWAVIQNEMSSYIKNTVIGDKYLSNNCTGTANNHPGSYAQAAIADVSYFWNVYLLLYSLYRCLDLLVLLSGELIYFGLLLTLVSTCSGRLDAVVEENIIKYRN